MNDTSKKALIVLAGLAVLVIVFMYVFKPANEDCDKLNTEINTLKTRLNDLIAKEAQKEQLTAETEQFNTQFDAILKNYPADLNQETAVMFFKSIEENNEFVNNTFSMPRETQFYKLGASASVSEDALSGQKTDDQAYTCVSVPYGVSYTGSYEGIKSVLAYVADYKYRMNISALNIGYDEGTDTYSGAVTMNAYAISGPGREATSVNPGVDAGTDNLFFRGDGSSSSGRPSKYDADDGAAIVQSNNVVVLLNSANSDLSSGIIVASNASKEDTYVTSNENSRVGLDINVYAEDGKNFVQYAIGDKSYTAEILSEDLAIYVKSSARVDGNDLNGVDVNVRNTTTLPVYFKVVDDDSTAPRFKILTRAGVKVY